MELVEDHGANAVEKRIGLESPREDPLGHDLNTGRGAGLSLEAHLIADLVAEAPGVFVGDALGRRPGRDTPRLEHDDAPLDAVEEGWWDACGLPCAGLGCEDEASVGRDGGDDSREGVVDGQVRSSGCGVCVGHCLPRG